MMLDGTDPLRAPQQPAEDRPLPPRLRLLLVGAVEPPWALLTLRLEAAGCDQASFEWQSDPTSAFSCLRQSGFDCVVLMIDNPPPRPGGLAADLPRPEVGREMAPGLDLPDVFAFIDALRKTGDAVPVLVVGLAADDEQCMMLDRLGCEQLVTSAGWRSPALAGRIHRAVMAFDLRRELSEHQIATSRGRSRDQEEAEKHLEALRGAVSRSGSLPAASNSDRKQQILARIDDCYQELLRTYVMMGSGSLAEELERLANLLHLAGVSSAEVLTLHIRQMELMLQGLGNRSSRHVLARADLLAIELLVKLGEHSRTRSPLRGLGDEGVDLLHAESLLQKD